MNRIWSFTIGTCLLASTAAAQDDRYYPRALYIGSTAGFGSSWMDETNGNRLHMPAGNIGVSVLTSRSAIWAWGASLLVSAEGYKVNNNGREQSAQAVYLRLPLKGHYYFTKTKLRPVGYFGPQFGVKVAEHTNNIATEGEVVVSKKEFNNFDWGIVGGGGLNYRLSETKCITLDAGYYKGFSDAGARLKSEFNQNRNWTINAGILFKVGDNR